MPTMATASGLCSLMFVGIVTSLGEVCKAVLTNWRDRELILLRDSSTREFNGFFQNPRHGDCCTRRGNRKHDVVILFSEFSFNG